jgi:signal transduction histidine kinase
MMNSTHIMIVDDDPALLMALTEALHLRMPEAVVDTCESGRAAMEKISQFDYDAVVTDIKMPGMDGLALLKEIRSLKPDLPTLLITGHGQHDLAVQALRGGAFDFVQKPVEREYFVASLNRAVNVRKMRRQIYEQQVALARHAEELEQAVQLRTEQLREANFRKDEFLAVLSHELRNPLATIRTGLEILALEAEHNRETLDLMQEQLAHLVRLVDDLLDTSRIVRGKIELRKEPVELAALVIQSVKAVRAIVERRQQKLVVELPEQPIWLSADPVRLAQVVENLLNNAIKYTDFAGAIELKARRQDGQAVISVRDTGVGIEPTLLPHIFDMFTQSSRAVNRSQGGLGIGLTLVRRIVELHDGSVSAHSEGPDRGSTFIVRLPIEEAVPDEGTTPVRKQMRQTRRILVVDDNKGAAETLSMLLTKRGHHQVEIAYDGASALTKVKEFQPEVILLDIGMPAMDGSEVARAIRAMHQFRDVVLVAVTGYGQEEDRRKSIEAGFDRHLVKPVEITEVEEVLADCSRPG